MQYSHKHTTKKVKKIVVFYDDGTFEEVQQDPSKTFHPNDVTPWVVPSYPAPTNPAYPPWVTTPYYQHPNIWYCSNNTSGSSMAWNKVEALNAVVT